MTSAAMSTAERDALASSLTLTTGNQGDSAQAKRKAASLKAAAMTPRGFRTLSGNIKPWTPDLSKCHVCGEDARLIHLVRCAGPAEFDARSAFRLFVFGFAAAQTADFCTFHPFLVHFIFIYGSELYTAGRAWRPAPHGVSLLCERETERGGERPSVRPSVC